jgi:hypothetical protein
MTAGAPFTPAPPRAAERLLQWSLAPDERAAVLGDVQEEFAAIAETDHARAVRWYWRQTARSVGPNIARQLRNQWADARRVIDEQDQRSRRRRLIFGLSWMAFVAVLFGGLAIAFPRVNSVPEALIFAIPGAMGVLTYFYRAMPVGSRRGQMAALVCFTSMGVGFVHTPAFQAARYGLWLVWLLFWMWPQAMWPFRRALAVRGYSVRSPVVTYPGLTRLAFDSIIVSPTPWSMSPVIVGRANPPPGPIDDDGLVPMMPATIKMFTSSDTVRLFAVVNAAPDGLHATLEIREATVDRVVATVPAAIRRAVPRLTCRQPHGVDPDSEPPLLPSSPMSEVDVVVALAGLAVGNYMFSLVATNGERIALQDVEIRVWLGRNDWAEGNR